MNIKQKRIILAFVSFLFLLPLASIALQTEFVYAADPCPKETNITSKCVQDNFDAAKKAHPNLSAQSYRDAINACEGEDRVGGVTKPNVEFVGTSTGNCSNAVRSCYEHAIDTRACSDKDVLAMAADCNNGNVSADNGSEGCGMDSAIDRANKLGDSETDFDTNHGIKEQRINDRKKAECNNKATVAEIEACEKEVENQMNTCYNQLGGTNKPVSTGQVDNCMQGASKNKDECDARSGNWDETTKRCTAKTAATQKCNDGSAPDANGKCKDGSTPGKTTSTPGPAPVAGNTGTCGKAKTVLIPSSIIEGCKDGGAAAIGGVMKFVILLLTAGIGIVAVGGIVYGAILYTSARDNAGQVNQAITIIRNVVIGLLLYIFMISILNWLVPGGVFV